MKIRNPYDREDLQIKSKDYVLEVGPGHKPQYRANVLAEKYITSNFHRNGDLSRYPHQMLVDADGEFLPFADHEFDYVICCQVLEHVDDPAKMLNELSRVAKRGYIETPSLIGESMFPKKSHRWAILEIDNKLILYDKDKIESTFHPDFGNLFLDYFPYKSLLYKVFSYVYADVRIVRYEWEGSIDYLINPEDDYYKSFFTKTWTQDMIAKIFPRKGFCWEIKKTIKAMGYITYRAIVRRVYRHEKQLMRGTVDEMFISSSLKK